MDKNSFFFTLRWKMQQLFTVNKSLKYFCMICGSLKVRQRITDGEKENYCTNCGNARIGTTKK